MSDFFSIPNINTLILMKEFIMSNYIILIWNIIVMFIYGMDKMQAKRGGWRISERNLLICAFLLGGYGAMSGMILFNHKTSKMKFRILVPVAAVMGILYFFLK